MDKHEIIQEHCPGSGRPAQKEWDQRYQWCPKCDHAVAVTKGRYLTSHKRAKV